MDDFTKQIASLINEEANKRTEKIVRERLNRVVKNLIRDLKNIEQIAEDTELSVDEVRESLQETVDIQNNILRLCGQTENLETIESFFHLDEFKSTVETDENKE